MRGQSCLVLGGGGFIGTNLCLALLAGGAKVRGFGRTRQIPAQLRDMEWIQGDLNEYFGLADLIDGIDIVYHLIGSGLPDSSNVHPADNVIDSIRGTVKLLDACKSSGVRKIIYVSSGGTVYGVAGDHALAETTPTEPISAYGIGKLTIEKYLALYRYLYGIDYVALRVANPYGPFQTANRRQGVVAALLKKAIRNETLEIWGDGSVTRDFLHVDDVIDALIEVASYDGRHHVFNVGSGIGRTVREIVRDIATVLRSDELRIVYRDSRRSDVPVNILDISLITEEIGWQPRVDWISGLKRTADWIIANPG